jgi:multiple sugar transport system permease protein
MKLSSKKGATVYKKGAAPFVAPALITLVLLVLYPFGYGLRVSLYETNLINKWKFVGLHNYIEAITDSAFWQSLSITLIFTVSVVVGHFIIGMIYANILNRNIKFKTFFRAVLLLPWIFPEVVIANLWKFIFHPSFGLLNSILQLMHVINEPVSFLGSAHFALFSVIVVCIWKGAPLVLIQILAALQTVPNELREAAVIDGATSKTTFWKIIIPSIKTPIVVTLIMDTVWWFKHVTMIWIMTQGGPGTVTNTISIDIYKRAFEYVQFGYSSAIAVIVFFICVLITFQYRRLLNEN